ncbi:MAG TPA: CBS domain-containing protein, partial [Bradyrhizobium sp.]|nr:CBS domain-containing protein [Bradyrhizobium sp.]
MHVAAVLKRKGSDVVSITPDKTIAETATLLTENRIGAALVLDGTGGISGLISERDIIFGLAKHGADALTQRVEALMTRDV